MIYTSVAIMALSRHHIGLFAVLATGIDWVGLHLINAANFGLLGSSKPDWGAISMDHAGSEYCN